MDLLYKNPTTSLAQLLPCSANVSYMKNYVNGYAMRIFRGWLSLFRAHQHRYTSMKPSGGITDQERALGGVNPPIVILMSKASKGGFKEPIRYRMWTGCPRSFASLWLVGQGLGDAAVPARSHLPTTELAPRQL